LEAQYKELVAALLPQGILEYFELTHFKKQDTGLYIHLEERNVLPQEFKEQGHLYHSKGFYPQITLQDFPIRGQKVFLLIKRRRWEHQQSGEVVQRDWSLVQKGTRMTAEFAAFLKEVFGSPAC
jgi:hypothetical protein